MATTGENAIRRYEADSGEIHLGRLNDTSMTLDTGNGVQVDQGTAATSPFWFQVSRGTSEYGLRPRTLGVCFQGTAPAGLSLNTTYEVAVLSPADFAAATITGTVAFQGQTAVVVTKTPESIYPGI